MQKTSPIIAAIAQSLEDQGITRRELAKRCGMADANVSRVLAGITDPQVSTVERMLTAIDMRLEIVPAKARRRAASPASGAGTA